MRTPFLVISLGLAVFVGSAHADVCFTVLDGAGKVMRQSRTALVDMSRPISATLYSRYPGASVMVFGTNDDSCEEIARPASTSPVVAPRGRRATRRM